MSKFVRANPAMHEIYINTNTLSDKKRQPQYGSILTHSSTHPHISSCKISFKTFNERTELSVIIRTRILTYKTNDISVQHVFPVDHEKENDTSGSLATKDSYPFIEITTVHL